MLLRSTLLPNTTGLGSIIWNKIINLPSHTIDADAPRVSLLGQTKMHAALELLKSCVQPRYIDRHPDGHSNLTEVKLHPKSL